MTLRRGNLDDMSMRLHSLTQTDTIRSKPTIIDTIMRVSLSVSYTTFSILRPTAAQQWLAGHPESEVWDSHNSRWRGRDLVRWRQYAEFPRHRPTCDRTGDWKTR